MLKVISKVNKFKFAVVHIYQFYYFNFEFKFVLNLCFSFSAWPTEKEYNLAELARLDTEEAQDYSKEHTLALLKKIQENLSRVGLEATALLKMKHKSTCWL